MDIVQQEAYYQGWKTCAELLMAATQTSIRVLQQINKDARDVYYDVDYLKVKDRVLDITVANEILREYGEEDE